MYDMESKEEKKILEGRHPVYSNSNEYIAYMGKDQKLTVYNVNTGENWRTVTIGSSTRYIFLRMTNISYWNGILGHSKYSTLYNICSGL